MRLGGFLNKTATRIKKAIRATPPVQPAAMVKAGWLIKPIVTNGKQAATTFINASVKESEKKELIIIFSFGFGSKINNYFLIPQTR